MQAEELKKEEKYNLSQGYIFEVSELQLKIDGKEKTIQDIYPEVDFDKTDYAVVLTQSCDLVDDQIFENLGGKIDRGKKPEKYKYREPKVTHITFCLLEPIDKWVDRFSKIDKNDFIVKLGDYIPEKVSPDIYSKEKALNILEKKIEKLLQNNDSQALFISLPPVSKNLYYFVNLTKILPVKIEHYESILDLAKYKLRDEFAGKLAWKLAYLYGRVGTTEYSTQDRQKIISGIFEIVESKVFQLSPKFNNLDSKTFNKFKSALDKAKTSKNPNDQIIKVLKKHLLNEGDKKTLHVKKTTHPEAIKAPRPR